MPMLASSLAAQLISVAHVSNVLGCVAPVSRLADLAHAAGAKLLLDACQSVREAKDANPHTLRCLLPRRRLTHLAAPSQVPHMPVDVASLGCDFLVASGHKMCGPTGIGFLWSPYDTLCSILPLMTRGISSPYFP